MFICFVERRLSSIISSKYAKHNNGQLFLYICRFLFCIDHLLISLKLLMLLTKSRSNCAQLNPFSGKENSYLPTHYISQQHAMEHLCWHHSFHMIPKITDWKLQCCHLSTWVRCMRFYYLLMDNEFLFLINSFTNFINKDESKQTNTDNFA